MMALIENSQQQAVEQLKQSDPILAQVIAEVGTVSLERKIDINSRDHFGALMYGIIGQQIAETLTMRILNHLKTRFNGNNPTPQELLDLEPEFWQGLGITKAKINYLKGLATEIVSGKLDLETLVTLPDEALTERLTAIKGIGAWTAEQFLFWHLARPDAMATGDPAIRKTVMRLYNLPALPSAKELEKLAEKWRPNRRLACHYLLSSAAGPGINTAWPTGSARPRNLSRPAISNTSHSVKLP